VYPSYELGKPVKKYGHTPSPLSGNFHNPKELLVVRVNLEKIRRRFDDLPVMLRRKSALKKN